MIYFFQSVPCKSNNRSKGPTSLVCVYTLCWPRRTMPILQHIKGVYTVSQCPHPALGFMFQNKNGRVPDSSISPRLSILNSACDQTASNWKFNERLSTANAASFVASDSDGCAWQIRAISSEEPRNSIATTASEINSEAIGPTIWIPRISSVVASARNFTIPDVSPKARARPLAINGNVPALYATPSAFNCCSVRPTHAISGDV